MRLIAVVLPCSALDLGSGGAAVADTNLLPNGGFSATGQIDGWNLFMGPNAGTLSWSSEDAGANADSGSMELDTNAQGSPTGATSPRFGVPAGGGYGLAGQGRYVVVNGISTYMFLYNFSCNVYATANCSGDATSGIGSDMPISATWADMPVQSGTLPADAKSANCSVYVVNP